MKKIDDKDLDNVAGGTPTMRVENNLWWDPCGDNCGEPPSHDLTTDEPAAADAEPGRPDTVG